MPSNRKQARTWQPSASTHTQRTLPTPNTHSDIRGVRGRRTPRCRVQAGISFGSGAGSPSSPAAFPVKRGKLQGPGSANLCRPRGSPKRLPRQSCRLHQGSEEAVPGGRCGQAARQFPPFACPLLSPLQGTRCTPDPRPQHSRPCTHERLYTYLPSIFFFFFPFIYAYSPPHHVIVTLILDPSAIAIDRCVFSLFSATAIKMSRAFLALS